MAWTAENRRAHRERNRDAIRIADRERKKKYGGKCRTCGAPTDGSNGPKKAPTYCRKHAPEAYKKWPRDRILAAMRLYYETYGELSATCLGTAGNWKKLTDERKAVLAERSAAADWPRTTTVTDEFGTWNAALDEAGIPRSYGPTPNGRRDVATDTGERVCETDGCTNRLSRYNKDTVCNACEAREIATIQAKAREDEQRRLDQARDRVLDGAALGVSTLCKRPACGRTVAPGAPQRGLLARLCPTHAEEAREQARERSIRAHAQTAPAPAKPGPKKGERVNGRPAPPTVEGSRAELAAEIAEVAAAMDELDVEREALRARERPLIQRWSDLMRAMAAYDGGIT